MGYTALYREWRPQTFGEVVGQTQVTTTLKNQITSDRIAHAYLLCGTRGTGKTTIAKILSKAVNCLNIKDGEPCNECEMCKKINAGTLMDVVEMDAASHRGIDKMRDIIEDVQYPPSEARYKVYIIDEVHMLTVEAVNSFLKTLEEPPQRVIFILATTDPQKLPITILSRCQRYNFTRIRSEDIYNRLLKVVNEKGVFADDESLKLISRTCDGAMRDALSILDQAISMGDKKISYDDLVNMLGLVTNENIINLANAVIQKDLKKALKIVDDIVFSGKEIYVFTNDFITHFRNILMLKVSENPEEVLDMSKENIDIIKKQADGIRIEEIMRNIRILQEAYENAKWSKQNRIYLELAIIKMCKVEYDTSSEVMLGRINRLERVIKEGKVSLMPQDNPKVIEEKVEPKKTSLNKVEESKEEDITTNCTVTLEMAKRAFKEAIELLKVRRKMSVYAGLINGELNSVRGGLLEIRFPKQYSFNKKRLDNLENKKLVGDVLSEILKCQVIVTFTVDSEEEDKNTTPEQALEETFGKDVVEILDE